MNEAGFRDYQPTRVEPIADVAEQAKAAGRDVQNAAVDLANTSAEALKGPASHAVEVAKDLASSAQNRLQDKVAEQKGMGADYVNNFAGASRLSAMTVAVVSVQITSTPPIPLNDAGSSIGP
jgi:hypothetical protein